MRPMTHPDLLILGHHGQLARALVTLSTAQGLTSVAIGRENVDLTIVGAAAQLIDTVQPATIINAAAYTAVDQAEGDEAAAFALNARAAGEAARAAAQHGARFIQVSTDYVFGAGAAGPHFETARPAPLNVYGRSKLAGEAAAFEGDPQAVIVRTSGVFSGQGSDFPSAIWRLAATRERIDVVDDQLTTPTYVFDVAERLIALAQTPTAAGIYHCGGGPGLSWAEFAAAALDLAASRGLATARVNPVASDSFRRPAQRPTDSRLASIRLEAETGRPAPQWKAGLERALDAWIASR